jgi:site-specific recombinase XerC
MSAIRKLAAEASDNGILAPELAAGIARVKSAKSVGVRTGNWLSARQAQSLLNAPNVLTLRGLRDRAILAVLLGCGLRRSEVAALTFNHLQQRDGRLCIVDLMGKHGRIRTMPMPAWVKVAIDAWTTPGTSFAPCSVATKRRARGSARRWSGRCCAGTRQKWESRISRHTICDGRARSFAGPQVESWSKSNCSLATRPSRRPSDILERDKIWCMRRTMRSN